jgi:hypothetical protein
MEEVTITNSTNIDLNSLSRVHNYVNITRTQYFRKISKLDLNKQILGDCRVIDAIKCRSSKQC